MRLPVVRQSSVSLDATPDAPRSITTISQAGYVWWRTEARVSSSQSACVLPTVTRIEKAGPGTILQYLVAALRCRAAHHASYSVSVPDVSGLPVGGNGVHDGSPGSTCGARTRNTAASLTCGAGNGTTHSRAHGWPTSGSTPSRSRSGRASAGGRPGGGGTRKGLYTNAASGRASTADARCARQLHTPTALASYSAPSWKNAARRPLVLAGLRGSMDASVTVRSYARRRMCQKSFSGPKAPTRRP